MHKHAIAPALLITTPLPLQGGVQKNGFIIFLNTTHGLNNYFNSNLKKVSDLKCIILEKDFGKIVYT